MKNIFLICLTLMAVLFTFSACHSEKMETGATDVTGQLSLASMKMEVDLKVDTVYPQSRAGVDVSNFLLTIKNSQGEQVEQYTYSEMPEIISLPVGTYTVVASSAEAATNGFDVPFYTGSTEQFTIKENELTEVFALTCRLANVMISVEYDEELRKLMGEDVVTNVKIGDNSLDIPSSETRKAYLIAPASAGSMDITLKGTIDGESVTEVKRVDNVQAGQYNIIKYVLNSVDDGTNSNVGGNLNIAINIDSSMTSSDETVGVNPGEEPGIDDFPTDGGEEPGDGDGDSDGDGEGGITSDINITGKKLGDSSFDIDQTQTITGATTLIVGIEAPAGIQNLKVKITSAGNDDFNGIGEGLGEFDLAHSDSMNENAQAMIPVLGLPIDDAVLNQPNLDFNISKFTSMLAGFEGTHTFKITVTDNQGKTESKSLVINVPKK
ncbi:DUF4493 domain-containing protein [Phocaeicola coprophilus]|mgnify:FL=1|jgi:hypothetical protein|uniref:DUF4493 domain-containing protein n=1 Tax=Phocaeicola coprophilus TaxID=387090 RepID=UPI00266BA4C9|nr:DUF4493 domain-containing protein [Phocaeicola coprophilus]